MARREFSRWISLIGCTIILLFCLSTASSVKKKRSSSTSNFALWEDVQLETTPAGSSRQIRSYLFDPTIVTASTRVKGDKVVDPSKKRKTSDGRLTDDEKDQYAINFIQDILEVIHKKQHPSKDHCQNRRLLAIQMSSTSFEGTGSLLKQAMLSLSIGMHSNRTVIWGLGYPFLFEHTKEIWDSDDNDAVHINNEILDCAQEDAAAGAFGCFFEPISSCALEDVAPAEMIEFSDNPHNDSARIALSEIRKGIAMYHPPIGLFEYIWSKRFYPEALKHEFIARQAHLWASAVSAYVFRLKPSLVESFSKKFSYIFDGQDSVWGLHIRHGDLKALSNVYAYKEVFDFEDYFNGALALSQQQQFTPTRIFVATDSVEADKLPIIYKTFLKDKKKKASKTASAKCEDNANDCEEDDDIGISKFAKKGTVTENKKEISRNNGYDDEDDYYSDDDDEEEDDVDDYEEEDEEDDGEIVASFARAAFWFGERVPDLMTINNSDRYRTEHGSHTVAANGGCLRDEKYNERGMRCALNYEAIVHYQTLEEHRSVPRSHRLMRVLLESIEDIYILSRCDTLVAQGSSHFSTLAALLVWARTGSRSMLSTVDFLDTKTIDQGFTPTAFLHGMNLLNGTNGIDNSDVSNGIQRWIVHTNAFISGLPNKPEANQVKLSFDPWSSDARIRLVNGLPHMLDQLFYLEAKHWLGMGKYKPSLPGQCPGKMQKGENPVSYVANIINLGVDHLQASHYGQAMICWREAMRVLREQRELFDSKQYDEFYAVARDNSATMRVMRYAEMVVNENRNSKEFMKYNDKYMKKPYDGVTGSRKNRKSSGGSDEKKLLSLEDVNEEIAELEAKLTKLKGLRDKLIAAHYSYLNGQLGNLPDKHLKQ